MPKNPSILIREINTALESELPVSMNREELLNRLTAFIEQLINHDFEKLVFYLYRVDVDEQRMRRLLDTKPENSARLIAELICERMAEKIKSRREHTRRDQNIADEDRW